MMNSLSVTEITFAEILPIWRDHLWPGRESAILPAIPFQYLGGSVDPTYELSPRFFSARSAGATLGVVSGYATGQGLYRSRGLFVFPEFRNQGIGRILFRHLYQEAKSLGAEMIWSMPRQSAFPFYQAIGFIQATEFTSEGVEFGPNCFAKLSMPHLLFEKLSPAVAQANGSDFL